jgi:uncharacterized protein YjiS (DUF1127 family)
MNEMNQALRRQYPRSQWLLELATPSVALGRGLPRNEFAAKPRAANANRPVAGLLAALVRAVVRSVKHYQTVRLLKQLDPHLLNDIGIARGEIDEIATKAAAETVAREGISALPGLASLAKLPASILNGMIESWRRQATITALHRLSDHLLADIGMERDRIAAAVDIMMARDETAAVPVRVKFAAKPTSAPGPAAEVNTAPVFQAA